MMNEKETVKCIHCSSSYIKDELDKFCCNCFCCTGCEIYICPNCNKEIIVRPIGDPPECKYAAED